MAIIDLKLPKSIAAALRLQPSDPRRQQLRVLKKLLRKARFTQFGQEYKFDEILMIKYYTGLYIPHKLYQEYNHY